jgi:hypothetical protein
VVEEPMPKENGVAARIATNANGASAAKDLACADYQCAARRYRAYDSRQQ